MKYYSLGDGLRWGPFRSALAEVLLDKVGKGLILKKAVVVEMAGGEYHGIKGMGRTDMKMSWACYFSG